MKIFKNSILVLLLIVLASCEKDELVFKANESQIESAHLKGPKTDKGHGPHYTLESRFHKMGGFANNAMVVFKGNIWSVGGNNAYSPLYLPGSDIWWSKNGKNWTFVKRNVFTERSGHSLLVYKNKLWVIGGVDSAGTVLNDIWNSSNGVDWQRVNRFTPIGEIGNNSSVVFKDRIFVFIGNGQTSTKVWSSSDGVAWRLESSGAFPVRNYTRTIVFKNHLYVVGGWDRDSGVYSNDVWASHDGRSWHRNIPGPSSIAGAERIFSPRIGHTMTVFNGKVWVIGGMDQDNIFSSEVWTTTNMKYWQKQEINPRIGPLKGHSSIVFDDGLWLFGGYRQASDLSSTTSSHIWSLTE